MAHPSSDTTANPWTAAAMEEGGSPWDGMRSALAPSPFPPPADFHTPDVPSRSHSSHNLAKAAEDSEQPAGTDARRESVAITANSLSQ